MTQARLAVSLQDARQDGEHGDDDAQDQVEDAQDQVERDEELGHNRGVDCGVASGQRRGVEAGQVRTGVVRVVHVEQRHEHDGAGVSRRRA